MTEEEQNELARWFLAESEWYAARREWEQNGYFSELLAQQEELARWLLAESEWKAKQVDFWFKVAKTYQDKHTEHNKLAQWLIAEQRWNAGQEFLKGLELGKDEGWRDGYTQALEDAGR